MEEYGERAWANPPKPGHGGCVEPDGPNPFKAQPFRMDGEDG